MLIQANHELNQIVPEVRMKTITTDGRPVRLHESANIISSSLYARPEAQTEIMVPSDPLTDVVAELRPKIIVMDVEGAEVDLLADIALEGVEALVVELHPHVVGAARIEEMLSGLADRGFVIAERAHKNVLLRRAAA